MDILAVKHQIQTKKFDDFYIFTGEEQEVMNIYIKKIAEVSKKEFRYIESMQDIYNGLNSRSLINKSYCYVVRDDKDIMENEKLQKQIKNGLMGSNILILLATNIDKRKKFYKQYKDVIVEFETLTETALMKYIRKDVDLSDASCQKLIEVCESNYGRILLEIDKLKQYRAAIDYTDDNKVYNHVLNELLEDGTIYHPPYDAIFDFVDAVLKRQIKKSFDLFNQCREVGEATMVMLSVLYSNTKALLQVQACEGNDISKTTGLSGWEIKNAKARGKHYSNGELVDLMLMIQESEKHIKQGKLDEQYAVERILVNCL